MPDYGLLYVPGYDQTVGYDQYARQDFGYLYSQDYGAYLTPEEYMDPYPDTIPNDPVLFNFDPFQSVPADTTYYQDPGPADIFSTLPPLFVTQDQTPPVPETATEVTSSGNTASGSIVVNVNNAIKNVTNISDKIGDIISQGIQDGADIATQTAKDSAVAVTNAVGGMSNAILNAVQSGIQSIWDWLKKAADFIATNAGNIISFLGNHLADIGHAIANDLVPIITKIGGVIDKVATQIQTINDTLIQPISNVIVGAMDTVTNLTKAIEGDLHDGLKGLLQIPTDVAGAMTSLDATMQRTIEQLGAHNKENVDVLINGGFHKEVGTHLDYLNNILLFGARSDEFRTTFADKVTLPEPGPSEISGAVLNEAWNGIKGMVSQFMKGGKHAIDDISKGLPGFVPFGVDMIQLPITLAVVVLTTLAELKPILEWMEEDAAGKAGLSKLSPGDALASWVRGFISEENLSEELKVNGWDAERIRVMKDLQQFLLDTATALDMLHRGIITEVDLRANMTQKAIGLADQDAIIQASYKVFGLDTALRSWKYGEIDDDALMAALRINRYTEDEVSAFMDTALRPALTADYVSKTQRDLVISSHLVSDGFFEEPPEPFVRAAKVEGVSPEVARIAWRASFQFPQLQQWLSLFFRGIRTHSELMTAMEYYRVPQNLREDYIAANRALLPFRTIPGMLAAGTISETYAKQQLQAHGYDLTQAEALLAYSKTKATTKPVTIADDLHSLSVAAARSFWEDGAITDSQYVEILVAHGYNDYTAQLTLQGERLHAMAKQHRQLGQDIINEAMAGLITDDQALQQMAQNNFTAAEMAKLSKQLRTFRRSQSKLPSEDKLRDMVKDGIIDAPTYQGALAALGYATNWVQALSMLNFPDGFPEFAGE